MNTSLGKRLVDGSTRILAIVGHPIAQVRAPEVWSAMFRHHGINALCIPFHVTPQNLSAFFAAMRIVQNLIGIIITIPHKQATVGVVDILTKRAEQVGSVNMISIGDDGRWTGDIIDGVGFIENLRAGGADPKGKKALLVGAGGVGNAMAFALAEAGVSELALYDKDEARARDVARRLVAAGFNARFAPPDPAGFDLVANATPVGMKADDPLPIDVERISPSAVLAEAIVQRTRLNELAAAKGCRTFDGKGMMEHQLVTMAENMRLTDHDFSAPTIARVLADLNLG